MANSPQSYLLLRNITGSYDYPRGTLLQLREDRSYVEHSHTRFYRARAIRLRNGGDVAPLSEVECNLLGGISSAEECYNVYNTPGKLEWGRSLEVGSTVLARVLGLRRRGSSDGEQQYKYTTAIVRWCGMMQWEGYNMFGVEIKVSSIYIIVGMSITRLNSCYFTHNLISFNKLCFVLLSYKLHS